MNLQRAILEKLNLGHLGMMPTAALWSEVRTYVGGVSYTEFSTALRELEEKEQVIVIKGEDSTKAKITDAGLARLLDR